MRSYIRHNEFILALSYLQGCHTCYCFFLCFRATSFISDYHINTFHHIFILFNIYLEDFFCNFSQLISCIQLIILKPIDIFQNIFVFCVFTIINQNDDLKLKHILKFHSILLFQSLNQWHGYQGSFICYVIIFFPISQTPFLKSSIINVFLTFYLCISIFKYFPNLFD